MKKAKTALCLACVFAVLLTACTTSGTPASSAIPATSAASTASTAPAASSAAPVASPKKDSIIVVLPAEPKTLDPPEVTMDTPTSIAVWTCYETLLAEKNGDALTIEPYLAESYEMSADGMEILLKIRKGVKFHNGDEMTVDDVEFSLNRSIKDKANFTATYTGMISHAEIVDDSHVKVVMKYPYMPVLTSLTNATMAIINKKYYEETQAKNIDFARNPCGTGVYKFSKWDSGEKITFEGFDGYWGGPAPVKTMVIKTMVDATTSAIALENGEVDFVQNPMLTDIPHLKSLPNIKVAEIAGGGMQHIFFNCIDETNPFYKKELRQAVAQSIDRTDILLASVDGLGVTIEIPVTPGCAGYDPDMKALPKDLARAKALLAEAGVANGFSATLRCSQDPMMTKSAEAIQAQVREIGIMLEVEPMEKGAYNSIVRSEMQYQMSFHSVTADIPDADFICHRLFHSKIIGSQQNMTGLTDPRIDEILDTARKSVDQSARNEMYKEVYEWVKDQCGTIPATCRNYYVASHKDLQGTAAHSVGFVFPRFFSWA